MKSLRSSENKTGEWDSMNIPDRSYILLGHNQDISRKIQGQYGKISSRSLDIYLGRFLNYNIVKKIDFDLIFLGDFYDPDKPTFGNANVVERIANDAVLFKDVLKNTYSMFGKWVIICDHGDKIEIMGDPGCTKSIKYYKHSLIVSDLASLVAHIADAVPAFELPNHNSHRKYAECEFRRNNWWPGDATLYRGVYSLLPNHILSMNCDGVVSLDRFIDSRWLLDSRDSRLKCCYDRSSSLVSGFLKSISSRCEIAVTVTGGRDSRVLYAACQSNSIDVNYFYSVHGRKSINDRECQIVGRLIRECGGKLNLCIDVGSPDSKRLIELYFKEIDSIVFSGYDYHSQLDGVGSEKIIMGLIPEIISCYYDDRIYRVSPLGLMGLARCGGSVFAFEQYSNWLNSVNHACLPDGYSVLDLFYWEHRGGRWAAQTVNVCDLFEDLVWGFNCREFYDMWIKSQKIIRKYPRRRNMIELTRGFGTKYVTIEYYDTLIGKIEYLLGDLGIRKPVRQLEYWLYHLKNRVSSLLGAV